MLKIFSKKNKGGFTLVETLVAISIFTVSILGLMSILSSGISSTTYAKNKMIAGYLAQEGIEYVRNMRDTAALTAADADTGWANFKTSVAPPALPPVLNSPDTYFTRILSVETTTNPDELKVTCVVSWTQPSGPQSVTLSENLFNWIQI
ncbi:MAG: prepilin-type N-terminal cleavage/methylation domain-containing protein [Candidatus Paceibacterota bacterium]